jgi:two-component system sensor histidine kinase ChvG
VIQHDVRRLDRLISDISDASRLDAELARNEAEPVDLVALLRAVVAMAQDSPRHRGVGVRLFVDGADGDQTAARYRVLGHDSRLAQVMTNLIDNARSFSEPGGEVRVALRRVAIVPDDELGETGERILITVEDDGPGIPPHALERIFERFYTDRPGQGFGQNSGLGLSISRQIVEAHRGRIFAQNRPYPTGAPVYAPAFAEAADEQRTADEGGPRESETARHGAGARFVISLPAAA